VATMYVVGSWVLLQLGDVVIEPLGLPEWIQAALIIGVIVLFPVMLVLAWLFDLTWGGVVRDSGPLPSLAPTLDDVPGAQHAGRSRRLAVLPFIDMGEAQSDAHLGDGLAEEILHALTRIPELDVIARASSFRFRGPEIDLADLAQQLNVSHVLSGSVRRGGERVRVKAELVEIASQRQIWSEIYQRGVEDLFTLQAELAGQVASALVGMLGLEPVHRHHDMEPEAYNEFLLAIADLRNSDFPEAIGHAERCIDLDPKSPRAHGLLAQAYLAWPRYGYATGTDELPLARTHARQALRIDPDHVPALIVKGMLSLYLERDFANAFSEVVKTLGREPEDMDNIPTLFSYANRFEDAVEVERHISLRDPLNVPTLISFARKLNWLGRTTEANDVYDRVRRIQPFHILMIQDEIELAIRDDRPDDAAEIFDQATKVLLSESKGKIANWLPINATLTWIGAKIEAARGNLTRAHEMAVELEADDSVNPTMKIECYLTAGDLDNAFRICDIGIHQFDIGMYDVVYPYVVRAPGDPSWVRFRDDARYADLLVRLGVDEVSLARVAWQSPSELLG